MHLNDLEDISRKAFFAPGGVKTGIKTDQYRAKRINRAPQEILAKRQRDDRRNPAAIKFYPVRRDEYDQHEESIRQNVQLCQIALTLSKQSDHPIKFFTSPILSYLHI
jgi:hypothetical protein